MIEETHDMSAAVPVLRLLRGAVPEAVLAARLEAARREGYRVLLAYEGGDVTGVLGFRVTTDLCWGRTFYVDDLVVRPEWRGQGVGARLLARARETADEMRCDHLRLCSGLSREEAHRFYEAQGLRRSSLQFVRAMVQGG